MKAEFADLEIIEENIIVDGANDLFELPSRKKKNSIIEEYPYEPDDCECRGKLMTVNVVGKNLKWMNDGIT